MCFEANAVGLVLFTGTLLSVKIDLFTPLLCNVFFNFTTTVVESDRVLIYQEVSVKIVNHSLQT